MKAGVASVSITPQRPIWMAGYASRDRPSAGIYHELFAKALVLEEEGRRAALVTADLIGLEHEMCRRIKARIEQATGLAPAAVMLACSHTHTGPETRPERPRYPERVDHEYLAELTDKITMIVGDAAGRLQEVAAAFATAPCTIAVNRRLPTADGMAMRPNPVGVTDPVVTVLQLARADGLPLAILMSYPCHPTTLGEYLLGGDYPGYAQDAVEAAFDGCTAMFVLGCAGDQKVRNVDGRGRFKGGPVEVAKSIGEELARAALLAVGEGAESREVAGPLESKLARIELPLQAAPTAVELRDWLGHENPRRAWWAGEMLKTLQQKGQLKRSETFTIQTLTLGPFALVGLAGEICVGYALRLKRELKRPAMIAGYANGMVGYIPTASMVPAGGYEVDGHHFYRMAPAPYAPEIEGLIVAKVHEMLA